MPSLGCRAGALSGLFVVASLAAGLQILPLALPRLALQRDWIKNVRAKMRGASYVGEGGVVLQKRGNDCGAACLKMVLAAHGIDRTLPELAGRLAMTPRGASMLSLRQVATEQGVVSRSWVIRGEDLAAIPLPAIAFIRGNHFVVIRKFVTPAVIEVDDPSLGRLQWPVRSFRKTWRGETLVFDSGWVPL